MTTDDRTSKTGVARRAAASFRPYTLHVIGIALLILITAGLGVVNPILTQPIFDDALFPQSGVPQHPPALDPRRNHGRRNHHIRRARHRADMGHQRRRTARHARSPRQALHPPPGPLARLLHRRPHRRDTVPHRQRRRRHPERRHQHHVQRPLQHRHIRQHPHSHDHPLMAANPHLRRHNPLLLPALPTRRPAPPPRHLRRTASRRRSLRHHPRNPLHLRHHARQAIRQAEPGNRTLPPRKRAHGRPRHTPPDDRPILLHRHANLLLPRPRRRLCHSRIYAHRQLLPRRHRRHNRRLHHPPIPPLLAHQLTHRSHPSNSNPHSPSSSASSATSTSPPTSKTGPTPAA